MITLVSYCFFIFHLFSDCMNKIDEKSSHQSKIPHSSLEFTPCFFWNDAISIYGCTVYNLLLWESIHFKPQTSIFTKDELLHNWSQFSIQAWITLESLPLEQHQVTNIGVQTNSINVISLPHQTSAHFLYGLHHCSLESEYLQYWPAFLPFL